MTPLLIDTGPLVALIRRKDARHAECATFVAGVTRPLLTTWPVVTEAAYLLRKDRRDVSQLLRMVRDRVIRIAELDGDAADYMARALARYADQNPRIADLSLLFLADRLGLDTVFTLDRRDFSILRREDGAALAVVPG